MKRILFLLLAIPFFGYSQTDIVTKQGKVVNADDSIQKKPNGYPGKIGSTANNSVRIITNNTVRVIVDSSSGYTFIGFDSIPTDYIDVRSTVGNKGITIQGDGPTMTFRDVNGWTSGTFTNTGTGSSMINNSFGFKLPGISDSLANGNNYAFMRFNGGSNKVYFGDNGAISTFQGGHAILIRANTGSTPRILTTDSADLYVVGGVTGGLGIKTKYLNNNTFYVNGSEGGFVRQISALRTLDYTDHTIECTGGPYTVTLASATTAKGREYEIINSGSATITISTQSSQVFVNVSATPQSYTIGAGVSTKIRSNGTGWLKLY